MIASTQLEVKPAMGFKLPCAGVTLHRNSWCHSKKKAKKQPRQLNKEPIVKIISKAEDFASFETYKKWLAKNEGKIRVVNVVYNPDRLGMFRSKRYLVTYEVQEGAEPDEKPDHWKF